VDGLIAKAKNGQPLPPLANFQPILTREQMQQVMQAAVKGKGAGGAPTQASAVEQARASGGPPRSPDIPIDEMQRASVSALRDYLDDRISIGDYKERLRKSFMNSSEEKLDELAKKAEQVKKGQDWIRAQRPTQ
jgi:hypothetical protein